ncbi:MAG: phospholipid carrier-dependent glycosyltransferase [Thermoproteota archaeon]|nr:phospholipid carrier-dependent glycosyltransferase [Thermoproteota archaeon]
MLVSLSLSSFTHLINPIGWPSLYYDEGIYLRRAMHLMNGFGPQEDPTFHDHPYFGQLFLAGILSLIGYPHIFDPQVGNTNSLELLYLIPRIIMGIIAVVDTFLIFQISDRIYNKRVALIASIIFGVTPLSWLSRWILLDSILVPFLLLSILLAIISNNYLKSNNSSSQGILLFLLSGMSLGLGIFTKIPVFVMIPLTGFLTFRNTKRSINMVRFWFLPIILIPMIWPAYSIINGQFISWLGGVYYQTHRESQMLVESFQTILFKDDPMFLILGIAGLIMAVIKKDLFILLWIIPFLLFFLGIGWVSLYHWIPLLPAFSISIAAMIEEMLKRCQKKRISKTFPLTFAIVLTIGSIGLVTTTQIITKNVNSTHFEAAAYLISYLSIIKDKSNSNSQITVIADPFYLWIAKYVFNLDFNYKTYYDTNAIGNRTILVLDKDFRKAMSENYELDERISQIHNSKNSHVVYIARDPGKTYNVTIVDSSQHPANQKVHPYP